MRGDKPAVPEEMCTGVPPAKSSPPRTKDQPAGFHVQHAIGSYTSVDQMNTNTARGPRRKRSANAPHARIGLPFHQLLVKEGKGRGVRDSSEHELIHTE